MSPQELQVYMSDITQQQMRVDRSRSTVNNADNNPPNEMDVPLQEVANVPKAAPAPQIENLRRSARVPNYNARYNQYRQSLGLTALISMYKTYAYPSSFY